MKPRININGTITEFETVEEHDNFVNQLSPTPDLTNILKSLQHEMLGKEVVRDLYVTLRQQNLTDVQEGDLLNRIFPVIASLGDGFIRGARVIANNIVVAGQYTTARKNYLLSKIDEAILKL